MVSTSGHLNRTTTHRNALGRKALGSKESARRQSDGGNPLASQPRRVATHKRLDVSRVAARHRGVPLVPRHAAAPRRPQRGAERRAGLPGRSVRACFDGRGEGPRPVAHGLGVARRDCRDARLGLRGDGVHRHLHRAAGGTNRHGRRRPGRDVGCRGHPAPRPRGSDLDCRLHRGFRVVRPRRHLHRRPAVARVGGLRQPGDAVRERRAARPHRRHQSARGQPGFPVGCGDAAGGGAPAAQPVSRIRQKTRLRRRPLRARADFGRGHLLQHLALGGAGRRLWRCRSARFRGFRAASGSARCASSHAIDRGRVGRRLRRGRGHPPSVRPGHRAAGGAASRRRMRNSARHDFPGVGIRRGGDRRHLERPLPVADRRRTACPSIHLLCGRPEVRLHRIGCGCAPVPVLYEGHGRTPRAGQPKQREPRWRRGVERAHRGSPPSCRRLHGGSDDDVSRRDRRLHADHQLPMPRRVPRCDCARHRKEEARQCVERGMSRIRARSDAPGPLLHLRAGRVAPRRSVCARRGPLANRVPALDRRREGVVAGEGIARHNGRPKQGDFGGIFGSARRRLSHGGDVRAGERSGQFQDIGRRTRRV